jgi:uncharacterized protein (TIGR03435 family)
MRALLLLASAIGAFAQPSTFTAADIHPSAPDATESDGFLPNGRVEFRATTLLRLISQAYSIPPDRIYGGPAWLDTDRFDVTAQGPNRASELALRTMLRPLLAERFGLAVEQQERPLPVFLLTLAKPGVLKSHEPTGAPDCKRANEEDAIRMTCTNMSIADFAARLPLLAAGYFNLPVVDRTGLTGAFDFSLHYVGRGRLTGENSSLSLFTALEKQTGVHAERAAAPLPVLAIAAVNRVPAPNPPGTAEKLGPAPTEFEVADIRPSRPGEETDVNYDNGRIDARALALRDLIAFAYNVEPDWIRGEKWIETERFDIRAKSPLTNSDDTFRLMLQNLLSDRFHLKVHKEPQPVDVYALTVARSKLKAADPATRATCKVGVDAGMRLYTCQNISMAYLAAHLRDVANGYINKPIVDLTGLTGAYDFTLSWTPSGRMARRSADDNAVLLTVFDALDRQLGLKLSVQKHPMPVVIVDRIDRRPSDN